MANPLLDFVMSLVRDPDAAARYAADSTQAIHDANLDGVTSADVNALIPVVSESLSMAAPATGAESLVHHVGGNVWASGAATAAFDAFDAFDDGTTVHALDDLHDVSSQVPSHVIDQPGENLHSGLDALSDAGVPAVTGLDDPSAQLAGGIIDDAPLVGDAVDAVHDDWHTSIPEEHHLDPGDTGFDIFD